MPMPKSKQPSSAFRRLAHRHNIPPPPSYGFDHVDLISTRKPPLLHRLFGNLFPLLRTDVPWYQESIGNKLDDTHDFFVEATGCKGEELEALLHSIRDRAWICHSYPCFGQWHFLLPGISKSPWYEDAVVKRAKEGATVLDLGCGLGQDLRRVAALDGVKPSQLYAVDTNPEFWKLGLELFSDATSPPATFIQADAQTSLGLGLDSNCEALFNLTGKVDVILMGQLLDIFECSLHPLVGTTIACLSRVGTQVVAYGRGAREVAQPTLATGISVMLHDEESIWSIWYHVEMASKTKWKIESKLVEVEEFGWEKEEVSCLGGPAPMGLYFLLTRVE